jgi:hypothetical protein
MIVTCDVCNTEIDTVRQGLTVISHDAKRNANKKLCHSCAMGYSPQDHLIYGTPRASKCPHCNQLLDAFGVCPDVPPEEAAIGIKYCMEGL